MAIANIDPFETKPRKMHMAPARMLLVFLGIPLPDQPRTLPEVRELLDAFRTQDAERWAEAIDTVIYQSPRRAPDHP